MTEGQQLALSQLQEIEQASNGLLEIVRIFDGSNGFKSVDLSLDCTQYEQVLKKEKARRMSVPAEASGGEM